MNWITMVLFALAVVVVRAITGWPIIVCGVVVVVAVVVLVLVSYYFTPLGRPCRDAHKQGNL